MRRSLLALLPLALLAGCDALGPADGPPPLLTELPRPLTAEEARVIEGSNTFAFDFLRELVERREGENVFTSPLSASMAFGMAMNGAAGETWTEMRDALGFGALTEEEINASYRDLIALLLDLDDGVSFGLANSMWVRDDYTLLQDFVTRLETFFDAEARAVDFGDPGTVDVINGWVSEKTGGRIEDLIETIPPEMVLYLINAIHFQGDWRFAFDADRTTTRTFHALDGGTVEAPMMDGEPASRVAYAEGAAIVEMPYGRGAFSAVAVLPPPDADPVAFATALGGGRWGEWMALLEAVEPDASSDLTVMFPKLELEWESDLNDVMVALGMRSAYACDATTDLSRIAGPSGLCILESKQMTFLKVDEKGTEAAAATYVGVGETSAPGAIAFDRPFVFAIRERLTGTILFLGLIGNPGAE